MVETTSQIAAGLSAATTGADTPSTMRVSRPARETVQALFVALGAGVAVTLAVLAILASGLVRGDWPADVKPKLIEALLWIALTAQFCVGVLSVALASSRLGQVRASAGPVNLDIEGKAD